ncbi:putative sigma-54 modulation protein [Pullulanibacillus pueri]|uniref:Ribosome hibernation promoting factor n=1 Tax=Pullulanibacillus pueri TaxID=1437324 RepID=A0A8J3ENS1_9BACL|nr:ribosome-associated translation inhibitor RaiA [Pullulanibacillus pueri]MBM7684157.1 putative sigma-54 modulation protein [Pullulanibacillus pueri]GGH88872.1 ribosome hibernation promotion factor [Pullulanibacillus pueri]
MNFNIRGENLTVTTSLRQYAERKISKLERYFDSEIHSDVHINLHVHNNEQVIEVTIPMQEMLLRAEEAHSDLYAAIDLVVEKLERQIRKYKTKVNRKNRQMSGTKRMAQYAFQGNTAAIMDVDDEEESSFDIVRTKRFNLKPMDAEEAILQMDMLGHNFFVFSNSETGLTNVVYKRKDGKYGLIEQES